MQCASKSTNKSSSRRRSSSKELGASWSGLCLSSAQARSLARLRLLHNGWLWNKHTASLSSKRSAAAHHRTGACHVRHACCHATGTKPRIDGLRSLRAGGVRATRTRVGIFVTVTRLAACACMRCHRRVCATWRNLLAIGLPRYRDPNTHTPTFRPPRAGLALFVKLDELCR